MNKNIFVCVISIKSEKTSSLRRFSAHDLILSMEKSIEEFNDDIIVEICRGTNNLILTQYTNIAINTMQNEEDWQINDIIKSEVIPNISLLDTEMKQLIILYVLNIDTHIQDILFPEINENSKTGRKIAFLRGLSKLCSVLCEGKLTASAFIKHTENLYLHEKQLH